MSTQPTYSISAEMGSTTNAGTVRRAIAIILDEHLIGKDNHVVNPEKLFSDLLNAIDYHYDPEVKARRDAEHAAVFAALGDAHRPSSSFWGSN